MRVQKTKARRAQKITEYLQAEDCTETELQRFEKVPHKVHTRKENTRGWGKKHAERLEVVVLGASSRWVIMPVPPTQTGKTRIYRTSGY